MVDDIGQSRLAFWDSRAACGSAAGTNDLLLKRLEIEHILSFLTDHQQILDAGCGSGTTAIEVLTRIPNTLVHGFDYSEAMVREASRLSHEAGLGERLTVEIGDLSAPPFPDAHFDAVYTERALINLGTFDAQVDAIAALAEKTKPNGRIILCESFLDGLEEINSFRVPIGLPPIEPPWHNTYFRLSELLGALPSTTELETVSHFSSTYYFLSRVVNAWQAREEGIEPAYEAPINQLALSLPSMEVCSQTKIVVLRRVADGNASRTTRR